jgi:hypothetical protein
MRSLAYLTAVVRISVARRNDVRAETADDDDGMV